MVRPWSPPLSLRAESASPLHSDDLDSFLLDFDPVNEWLVDPDQFLMSVDEVKVLDPGGFDSNKVESYCPLNPYGPAMERSNLEAKGQVLCPSIDERMKNVSLVEDTNGNAKNAAVLERMASAEADDKATVKSSLGDAKVVMMSSGVGGSEENDVANGCTAMAKANGASDSRVGGLVKVANESDEESSGTESDGLEEEDDDSGSNDTSSSEDGNECPDFDDDDESDSRFRGVIGVDAEGDIEEGEIRDVDQEEMIIGSEEDEEVVKGPIRSKNEVEDGEINPDIYDVLYFMTNPPIGDLPPVSKIEVLLEPHHQSLPVGVISAILDNKVIVEGLEKHNPLNEGSILWITQMRLPLGFIDEIFGPVKKPFYVVRYNSDKEVPAGISVGTAVSFVLEFATYILNHKELYKKAYDASGENDEELSDEVEFSDDEKEAEYKKSLRLAKRGNDERRKRNQESFTNKRKFKGASVQKDMPPSVGRVPEVVDQLSTGVTGPIRPPLIAGNFGCSNYGSFGAGNACVSAPATIPAIPLAIQISSSLGLLPQQLQQQLNASWINGFPHQQQQHIGLQGGFTINELPGQQLANQAYAQLHQTQFCNSFPNAIFQQQFIPSLQAPASIPWLGGLTSPSIMTLGSMWNGNFGQETSGNMLEQGAPTSCNERIFGQAPPATAQGGVRSPRHLNQGRTSFHGTKPHHRGGRHFYGRGGPPHNR